LCLGERKLKTPQSSIQHPANWGAQLTGKTGKVLLKNRKKRRDKKKPHKEGGLGPNGGFGGLTGRGAGSRLDLGRAPGRGEVWVLGLGNYVEERKVGSRKGAEGGEENLG